MKYVTLWKTLRTSTLLALGSLSLVATIASARPTQVNLAIEADRIPSFGQLLATAESLAFQRISQAFATNPGITSLSMEVMAERNGAIVPLMTIEVPRDGWRRDARLATWAQYFESAEILLSYRTLEVPELEPTPVPEEPTEAETTEFPTSQEGIELQDDLD